MDKTYFDKCAASTTAYSKTCAQLPTPTSRLLLDDSEANAWYEKYTPSHYRRLVESAEKDLEELQSRALTQKIERQQFARLLSSSPSASAYPSNDDCLKCCGLLHESTCKGQGTVDEKAFNTSLQAFKELMLWGVLLGVVGTVPALAGGYAKFKGDESASNALGTISVVASCACGFLGTAVIALLLSFIGAVLTVYCTLATETLAENEGDLKAGCDTACLDALKHETQAMCNAINGMSLTGTMLFVLAAFGFLTFAFVCVGFCQHKTPAPVTVTTQQVVMTPQQPVQATVIQTMQADVKVVTPTEVPIVVA